MKKFIVCFLAAGLLVACNDSATGTSDPIDSLEKRGDTLQKNIDSSFDANIDSLEERKDELKDKFDSTIQAKKDSLKKSTN